MVPRGCLRKDNTNYGMCWFTISCQIAADSILVTLDLALDFGYLSTP